MSLDVSHIPGEYNKDADMLSRIEDFADLPDRFPLTTRLVLDLESALVSQVRGFVDSA